MSDSLLPPLRPEVQNFLRSCEHLLSVPAVPHNPPFSPNELLMMNHYAAEVTKMVGELAKL